VIYYNNEYISFPDGAILDKKDIPMFSVVGMEIFDNRYLDETLVTEWHILKDTSQNASAAFTRPAGKGSGYPLIVIQQDHDSSYTNDNKYFSVFIQSIGQNAWPAYQELERISYNPYDVLFYLNDKADSFTGKRLFGNMFSRMTKKYYFRYLSDEGQAKPEKTVENFLYNKKHSVSTAQYSQTNALDLPAGKRNNLQFGLNHQKDEFAYNSNNMNRFFDSGTNGYKSDYDKAADDLTDEQINANRNALGYVHYDKNSYMNSDIQTVFIRPKQLVNQNTFTRYSNKRLTEFPLGGTYRSNGNQVFTLLDLRQKDENGNDIFRPYPEQSDTVVCQQTIPLVIQYKNLHTDDSRPCVLTINVTYQIRARRVRLANSSNQPYYSQMEKSFDTVKKEKYNNQKACNIPFSDGITSLIWDYEKKGGYITVDSTY
jgi:hypothetical protein